MAKKSEAVSKVEAVEEQNPTVVEDVVAEAKAAVVHEDEVAAIKDSRKRDLPLFRVDIAFANKHCGLWDLLNEVAEVLDGSTELYQRVSSTLDACIFGWVVAVSEHQAKMAFIDRAYPMEKISKKDRDYRLLHLLEAKDAAATE